MARIRTALVIGATLLLLPLAGAPARAVAAPEAGSTRASALASIPCPPASRLPYDGGAAWKLTRVEDPWRDALGCNYSRVATSTANPPRPPRTMKARITIDFWAKGKDWPSSVDVYDLFCRAPGPDYPNMVISQTRIVRGVFGYAEDWWSGYPGESTDLSALGLALTEELVAKVERISARCPGSNEPAEEAGPTATALPSNGTANGRAELRVIANAPKGRVRVLGYLTDADGVPINREEPLRTAWRKPSTKEFAITLWDVPAAAARFCVAVEDSKGARSAESCAALTLSADTQPPEVLLIRATSVDFAYRVLDNSGYSTDVVFVCWKACMGEFLQSIPVAPHRARGNLMVVPWVPNAAVEEALARAGGKPRVVACVVAEDAGQFSSSLSKHACEPVQAG